MPGLSRINKERRASDTTMSARCYMRRTNTKQNKTKQRKTKIAPTHLWIWISSCDVRYSCSVGFCFSCPFCFQLPSPWVGVPYQLCGRNPVSGWRSYKLFAFILCDKPSEMEPSMGQRVVSFSPCYCKTGGVFRYLVYTRYYCFVHIANVWFIPRNEIYVAIKCCRLELAGGFYEIHSEAYQEMMSFYVYSLSL